ncbi:hypothetical protein D9756_002013 [Leucocoprinus leucothites]|uniref:F-box domain-containing protein n=1 Tax=Leucocoprinus leucothites TaxID=201217 RepID=A0A8H5GBN1_9AGAR|nr:hypothetical protein D9756_002013 [Leucoagaricus leucothites]
MVSILHLPPEILAAMFKIVYCPANQPRPADLFSLSAVCSRWRYVVWSTPELWTYLFLDAEKYESDFDEGVPSITRRRSSKGLTSPETATASLLPASNSRGAEISTDIDNGGHSGYHESRGEDSGGSDDEYAEWQDRVSIGSLGTLNSEVEKLRQMDDIYRFETDSALALLRLFYLNLGSLPISITFHEWAPNDEPTFTRCLDLILRDNGSRLRELIIDIAEMCEDFWHPLYENAIQSTVFGCLERLDLDMSRASWQDDEHGFYADSDADDDMGTAGNSEHGEASIVRGKNDMKVTKKRVLFRNSPLLRDLTLRGRVRTGKVYSNFPWGQLARLRLELIKDVARTLQILSLCPNLVEFSYLCWDHDAYGHPAGSAFIDVSMRPSHLSVIRGSFVMEELQEFRWIIPHLGSGSMSGTQIFTLFKSFRFPNLERLYWGEALPTEKECPGWKDFFTGMQKLTYLDCWVQERGCLSLWKLFPFLQEIHIRESFSLYTLGILDHLTIRQGDPEPLLPYLESMTISLRFKRPLPLTAISFMLASRRLGPLRFYGPIDELKDNIWYGDDPPDREMNELVKRLPVYEPDSPHWRDHRQLQSFTLNFWEPETTKKCPLHTPSVFELICCDARLVVRGEKQWKVVW